MDFRNRRQSRNVDAPASAPPATFQSFFNSLARAMSPGIHIADRVRAEQLWDTIPQWDDPAVRRVREGLSRAESPIDPIEEMDRLAESEAARLNANNAFRAWEDAGRPPRMARGNFGKVSRQ